MFPQGRCWNVGRKLDMEGISCDSVLSDRVYNYTGLSEGTVEIEYDYERKRL